MESPDEKYTQVIHRVEDTLLHFFRTFEKLQEEIYLNRVGEAQTRLQEEVGDSLAQLTSELSALTPPESLKDFHTKLSEAVTACADSYSTFLSGKGQQFPVAFLSSREAQCRGLCLLYELRAQLPGLQ